DMNRDAEAIYLLAFDHRGSFQKTLLGIAGEPTSDDVERIKEAKAIIFAGFRQALDSGLPLEGAGILVDETFGADVAREALELRVPAEPHQLERVGGDQDRYDRELRPDLMIETIRECQDAGVEPDIWKIEGLDAREDCVRVADAARAGDRDHVRCVVLGRGGD